MRLRISRIFATAAVCALARFACADMLWWMVDETARVDDSSLYSFIQPYAWEEDGYSGYDVGARVKIVFKDGTSTALPVYNDGWWDYSPLDDSGDGHGISTGNWASQSPLDGIDSEMLNEALFQIELGSLTYNEALDMFGWDTTIAESDKTAKEYLTRYIWQGGVLPPADAQWTPVNFHSVPEPSSGLLAAVGLCVLALRRRRA